jgi:hypothetical protein
MMFMDKLNSICSLLNLVCLSLLLGMLLVDFAFDAGAEIDSIRTYYCSLTQTFSTVPGIARIIIPVAVSGVSSLCLCVTLPTYALRRLERLRMCLMSFIGFPVVIVSVVTCGRRCAMPNFTHESLRLVYGAHLILGALFLASLSIQTYTWLNLQEIVRK